MNMVVSHQTRRVAAFKPKPAPVVSFAGEADVLSELLAATLSGCHPGSAAVLGNSGGRLILNLLRRDDAGQRYTSRFMLELSRADLTEQVVAIEPVELVHAALVLDQAAEVSRCLDNLLSLVAVGGALSVVLQASGEFQGKVSRGCAPTIQKRKGQMDLISPVWLLEALQQRGFHLTHQTERSAPSGRRFWLAIFQSVQR